MELDSAPQKVLFHRTISGGNQTVKRLIDHRDPVPLGKAFGAIRPRRGLFMPQSKETQAEQRLLPLGESKGWHSFQSYPQAYASTLIEETPDNPAAGNPTRYPRNYSKDGVRSKRLRSKEPRHPDKKSTAEPIAGECKDDI